MIAAKIFNNNALATVTDEGQDAILIGLGIGFEIAGTAGILHPF